MMSLYSGLLIASAQPTTVLVIKCGLKLSLTLYRPDIRYFSTNILLSYRIINAGRRPDDLIDTDALQNIRQWEMVVLFLLIRWRYIPRAV